MLAGLRGLPLSCLRVAYSNPNDGRRWPMMALVALDGRAADERHMPTTRYPRSPARVLSLSDGGRSGGLLLGGEGGTQSPRHLHEPTPHHQAQRRAGQYFLGKFAATCPIMRLLPDSLPSMNALET